MLGQDDQEPSQRHLPEARGQQPDRGRREGHRDGPDLARRAELTREEFAAQLERAAAQAAGFPVSAAVFAWTSSQLKRGEPAWWKTVAKAWEKRRFASWSEAPHLLLSALHFDALSDAESPLVRFFPSCGGTAEADPAPGVHQALSEPGEGFLACLREREHRPYQAGRALLWSPAAMLFFQRRGLPYYVVQADAGAGLDLAMDEFPQSKPFDSELVAARIGLDSRPLDVDSIEDRRWLTACVYPDAARQISDLDACIEAVSKKARSEANFIQLVECPAAKAPAFAAKNIPSDDEDVGLLFLTNGATTRMDDSAYSAFGAAVASALKPWGDRGLWMELESVRGEIDSRTLQQRVFRWSAGQFGSAVLATYDLAARRHAYNQAAEAFLDVPASK